MATTLQVSRVGKSYNTPLFEDVTLVINDPGRIGLIGDNGSGKSTFLKILAGRETPDQGEVVWSRDAKIGYLEQEIVTDTFYVSGGEKKILRLTELFYSNYDVLLLDEPDNHLDLDHKLWFENLVKDYDGILIVVSHDRRFLESSVDKIWHLEETRIKQYSFNYSKYKIIYESEMTSREHLWEVQEKERQRLVDVVVRLQRLAAAHSKLSGRYRSAVKRLERFVDQMVEKPPEDKRIALGVNLGKQHKRKTAIHLKDVRKTYGDIRVLNGLSLHVFCGEKLAISAPNGSGKSTLLHIVAGKISEDSGVVNIGSGLKMGYYAQEHLQNLDENATLIEEIQKSVLLTWYDAIAYLKKFLFDRDKAGMKVKWLSGGQKSRLQLAKFLGTNPDILVLDEPTNHFDLKTVVALERFLKDYTGTLVLASHDRVLVENVVDTVYHLEDGILNRGSQKGGI